MRPTDINKIVDIILRDGPRRVVINEAGEAVSSERAQTEYHITPTVVFVRKDGWSLGAPEEFKKVARGMWAGDWVANMTWDGAKWVTRLWPEESEPQRFGDMKLTVTNNIIVLEAQMHEKAPWLFWTRETETDPDLIKMQLYMALDNVVLRLYPAERKIVFVCKPGIVEELKSDLSKFYSKRTSLTVIEGTHGDNQAQSV